MAFQIALVFIVNAKRPYFITEMGGRVFFLDFRDDGPFLLSQKMTGIPPQ
jgi:hypothetical protein